MFCFRYQKLYELKTLSIFLLVKYYSLTQIPTHLLSYLLTDPITHPLTHLSSFLQKYRTDLNETWYSASSL